MPSPTKPPPVESTAAANSRLTRLGPALFAAAAFVLHAACLGRYGLFRDELYFLVCGQRLSTGYVDQPPGIALVARLAFALFGTWVPGLRLFAWIAVAGTVYLAGRLSARISGGGTAATLGALAAFSCPVLQGASHTLSMNAFEPFLVVALAHVLLRLSQGEDPRLWVAAGGLAGLSVLMKYTAGPLALFLIVGLAVAPARRALRTPWALAGAAFGALLVLPNLAWQASHGFPFLGLVHAAVAFKNTPTGPAQFLEGLFLEANPLNAPLWAGGLLWLLFAPRARAARLVGIGGLLQLLALTFGRAKPYYATALLPLLLAGGAVAAEAVVRSALARRTYGALVLANALFLAPLAVPILPVEALVRYLGAVRFRPAQNERLEESVLPQNFADQFGWRELTAGVARVYRSLPPEEKAHAAVFGENYGVASAVEILGPQFGLPRGLVFSGHNQYWFWGIPPGRGDPLILVSDRDSKCKGLYREQLLGEQLPVLPYAMPYENGHAIWICRGLKVAPGRMPPSLRHFE
ncbi:MAG TPA: glycosyltransferase family 39 protein [Anaeromyxobacter sp.]|nr:glycosyltransferase family 39 protein [Anaeromyxobacter sp.]